MRERRPLADRLRLWLFKSGPPVEVRGVWVTFLNDDPEDDVLVRERLEAAFGLLELYDPRRYARFRRDVAGVLVYGTVGPLACWIRSVRLVELRASYAAAPETTPGQLASTLVHEGTHAWLARLGFDYRPERRARIEAVCFRSEIAFARRVPAGAELVAAAERQLPPDASYFTPEAFRERNLSELRELGVPRWIVWTVDRLGRLKTGAAF